MNVAHLIHELNPDCVSTGSQDAYPVDKGFRPSEAHPKAANHRADAYVFDIGTDTEHLIDYTFANSMKPTGTDGAAPGGHADVDSDCHCRRCQCLPVVVGPPSESSFKLV